MSDPTVSTITRTNGVAGQFQYAAQVQYPGEAPSTITFVGNTYGGPIVMVTPLDNQIIVSSRVTDRIGTTLTPEWVRAFFAPNECDGCDQDPWRKAVHYGTCPLAPKEG